MTKISKMIDISDTLALIDQNNEAVKEMLKTWSFLRGSPKPSEKGPTLSPGRAPRKSDIDSPVSLEALKAYQAASRISVFTPPNSPSKKRETDLPRSPYSLIGPS